MATIQQKKAQHAFEIGGGSPDIREFREGISQTFKSGALVYLTASGTVKVVPGAVQGAHFALVGRVLGLALKDGANSLSPTTDIPVVMAAPGSVFIMNSISRTSVATSTLARANVGLISSASVNGSRCYFDTVGSAAASSMRCLGLVDEVGDVYGRVLVTFLDAASLIK